MGFRTMRIAHLLAWGEILSPEGVSCRSGAHDSLVNEFDDVLRRSARKKNFSDA